MGEWTGAPACPRLTEPASFLVPVQQGSAQGLPRLGSPRWARREEEDLLAQGKAPRAGALTWGGSQEALLWALVVSQSPAAGALRGSFEEVILGQRRRTPLASLRPPMESHWRLRRKTPDFPLQGEGGDWAEVP